MDKYDFSGYATRNDLECGDGRTIKRNAFKDNDGTTVPLVWMHNHDSAENVLGHALLENRDDGVYAYCTFNNTDAGNNAKELVKHKDVTSLSIYANRLKQVGGDVVHGVIRELSLVLAPANPGAKIDYVMAHSDDGSEEVQGITVEYHEDIELYHADSKDEKKKKEEEDEVEDSKKEDASKKEEPKKEDEAKDKKEPTIKEIYDGMTDDQKKATNALVGQAIVDTQKEMEKELKQSDDSNSDSIEGDEMKHNLFENDKTEKVNVISHAAEGEILEAAKKNGSFQQSLMDYVEANATEEELKHGIIEGEVLDTLFPDYQDVYGKQPETLTDDMTWVNSVVSKAHKTPFSRIRTRQLDAREKKELDAKGYKKGTLKSELGNMDLLQRTTDPQTVYVKSSMNRDDIVDFTDFDVVGYTWNTMRASLNKELAQAILIGDGRTVGDPDKISEEHIRPIWTDDPLYTIYREVDIAAAKTAIQGTDTNKHFSENYIYAEAIVEAILYAKEKYKGSGNLSFYCTPHLKNVMLLSRDLNGRRIYRDDNDLRAALDVSEIITIEQFEGLKRTDDQSKSHNLLGILVNMADYNIGSTKGGEITSFSQFDIDYNREKYLIETRLSGALTRVKSAIVLEEPGV